MSRLPLPVWGYALLIALLTSLPYMIGVIQTPEGWQYSGAAVVPDGAKVDYYSHMAKMWQGARGEFDYQLLFTHEEHAGLPTVQAFYVVLGAIAGFMSLDFGLMYHLVRFVLTTFMVVSIWAFMSRYLATIGERWVGTFFATLVFGWSWILFFIAPEMTTQPEGAPIELWLLDAYNLLGALIMPHFAMAVILQIVAFLTFDSWLKQPNSQSIFILTLTLLLSAIVQPYVVLMMFPIFGIVTAYFVFVQKTISIRQSLWLMIPALAHGGIAVMQYLMISGDPIWAGFTAQNQTLSPPPIYYVLGYLPLLIPITLGFRHIQRQVSADQSWILPLVWIGIVILLLYAPFPTQRRYLLGVQTPLALLAGLGWYRLVLVRIAESWRPFANIPYITAGALAFVLVLFGNIAGLMNPTNASGVFYSSDELGARDWIISNIEVDDLILTTFDWDTSGNGGQVVGMTGRRVFVGHWIETANFDVKREQLMQFYDAETDDNWRQEFLAAIDAQLIWYDTSIAGSFGDWQPDTANYLEKVYDSDTVQLYVVMESAF